MTVGPVRTLTYSLFFLSGAAALAYQVVWTRQLSFIFGSTAQAAALVIAVFFTGIAVGSWFWGRRVARHPLRTFGWLEVGVGITALAHFGLYDIYQSVYPALYAWSDVVPGLEIGGRMLIAGVVLFPASFLMGGTLPAMAEVIAEVNLAKSGSMLYAINTLGGASGAFAAGFIFPPVFGFTVTYLIAVAIDLSVGGAALLRSRGQTARPIRFPRPSAASRPRTVMWIVAFGSGAATLGVEIVWTRLFAQVLQNSAYTYAIVLSAFLVALACGALIARLLATRLYSTAPTVLASLLLLSALVAVTSPWVFTWATGGALSIGDQANFVGYIFTVLRVAALVILVPGAILGAVLPFLIRFVQSERATAGQVLGRLVMVNTVGAVLGALATGFVLLPSVGTWGALLVIATIYCVLALLLAIDRQAPIAAGALAAAGAVALVAWTPPPAHTVRLINLEEQLIAVREGAQATVTVIGQGSHRALRVNNSYTLGGTRSQDSERTQALLPLALHGEADSVFALGMGTGITAGGALTYPISRLLVCELIDDVVLLARDHFEPWTNNLFADGRVEIQAEDGRICLSRSQETFDVIVSDLFTPWQAGTGNVYTLEHFATARQRLNADGIFVQWIPLYQVSEKEFGSLAHTMSEVFDQVTVWRGDFFPSRSIVALVGHTSDRVLDPAAPFGLPRGSDLSAAEAQAALLRMYVGNVGHSGVFAEAPVNTDSSAFIEYSAPRTQRAVRAGKSRFLTGTQREALYEALSGAPGDPFLADLSSKQLAYISAGRELSRSLLLREMGRTSDAERARSRHDDVVPRVLQGETSLARLLIGRPK